MEKPRSARRKMSGFEEPEVAPVTVNGTLTLKNLLQHLGSLGCHPGDKLPSIRTIAEELKVSPNVVRDALLEGQTKGIVKIVPRSGAYLQSPDFSRLVEAFSESLDSAVAERDPNLFQLIETRGLIEGYCAEVAARRRRIEDVAKLRQALSDLKQVQEQKDARVAADEKFHLAIAAMSGNDVLVIILQAILTLLRPYRALQVESRGEMRMTFEEHEKIYEAIKDGDTEKARRINTTSVLRHQEILLGLDASDTLT